MDINEIDRLCASHDWYYAFSDDYSVWRRGERHIEKIREAIGMDDAGNRLFKAWTDHFFSGPNWDTPYFDREALDAVRKQLGVTNV